MMRRRVAVLALLLVAASLRAVAPEATWGSVRVNEICWGGSPGSPTAEWIELVNMTDRAIDLAGWRLVSSDGSPDIVLSGIVLPTDPADPAAGYVLLERASDACVPDVTADAIYDGALSDRGEILFLYDATEALVDTANALPASSEVPPWAAGTNAYGDPPHRSMERVDARLDDAPDRWATCPGDSEGFGGSGTPRQRNYSSNLLPSASFRVDPPAPQPGSLAVFDATGSADEGGRIEAYIWDFGDGAAVTGPAVVTHAYTHPGRYEASLAVRDNQGAVAYARRWITVATSRPPIADFSVRSLTGRRGLSTLDRLRFQDESSDEESDIVAWAWSFGDGGTATEQHPEHTYAHAGQYTVSLVVHDGQAHRGVQSQSLVVANRPPEAGFSFGNLSPSQGETIVLDASRSVDPDGTIVSYAWDLDGDGAFDLETDAPTLELVCERGGDLSVALVVADDQGDLSLPAAGTVYVNHAPVAQFTASSPVVDEREAVRFSDCSYDPDGEILTWRWEFGDGLGGLSPSPEHVYGNDGTYPVSLSVEDDDGATGTTAISISVHNLPPRPALSVDALERDTGQPFAFDASGSNDPSPCGRITAYEWDYDGDGCYDESTTLPGVRRTFDQDGTFSVRVRVTDDDGAAGVSDPVRVTVRNRAPSVGPLAWEPQSATDADEVALSAVASDPDGEVVQWRWTFGDGSTSEEATPRHRFPDDGRFLVSVQVIDEDGSASETASCPIDVANAPPQPEWEVSYIDDCPHGVAFDATSSFDPSPTGSVVHVAWDFGDGTTCPGSAGACGTAGALRPIHCYAAPGSYIVTLIILDEEGAIGRSQREILLLE